MDAAAGVEQPKRKRARRGSRGGRKRKKPTASSSDTTPAADSSDAAPLDAEEPPAEYVPMTEWLDDFETRSTA
jgi:hypothetical protein